MEAVFRFINEQVVWGLPLVLLCLAGSIYFTIRTRFVQIRLLGHTLGLLKKYSSGTKEGKISGFAAFAISTAGKIGVGNIVGVGVALQTGGAGAIFWMWCFGLFGAALSFAECSLAQKYRVASPRGGHTGGTGRIIGDGLGLKRLGGAFTVLMIITVGILMTAVQSNALVGAIEAWSSPNPSLRPVMGFMTAALFWIVAAGGRLGVARFAERLLPVFALGYMGITLFIIATKIENLPGVFADILGKAFGIQALGGGAAGTAIAVGIRRGMFSCEAGYGIAPYAAATAESGPPAVQGLIQSLSIFVDTSLMCTLTGLMILVTGADRQTSDPIGMSIRAIDSVLKGLGLPVILLCTVMFAFTTIVSCGFIATESLKGFSRVGFYTLMGLVIFCSALVTPSVVWDLCDTGAGLMAWINIPVLLALSRDVIEILREYEKTHLQHKKAPPG